jgi:hypothetical protein
MKKNIKINFKWIEHSKESEVKMGGWFKPDGSYC